jgi:putative flippase GtrA
VPCASLLRRRPAVTDAVGEYSEARSVPGSGHGHDSAGGLHTLAERLPLTDRLRRDDIPAQFIRFVLVGGSSTAVYAVFFLSLQWTGYLAANIVGTLVSSVMANELHRRLTFHADERVSWVTAQLEAGGVSLFGLVATSVALGWLDAAVGSAPPALQVAVFAAVTGFIGLIRFVALRWIFRPAGASAAQ